MDSLKEQIDRELQGAHFDVEGFMEQWDAEKEGRERHRKAGRRKILAAVFAAALFCCGGGAYASVNHFQERGSRLTCEERDAYVEDITNAPVEADTYSRELTEEERERRDILMEKYLREGLYPKEKLRKICSVEEAAKDRVCFLPETSTFYLPERELTDEDLLQIIDHDLMVDYSLAQARQAEKAGTEQESGQNGQEEPAEQGRQEELQKQEKGQDRQEKIAKQEKGEDRHGQKLTGTGLEEISVEEAVACAKEAVQRVYGEDTGGMEVETEQLEYLVEGEGEPYSDGIIHFTKEDGSAQYTVLVNMITKDIEILDFGDGQDAYVQNRVKPGNVLEEDCLRRIKEKACLFMGEGTSVQKGHVQLITNQEGNLANGVITYYFEMSNGRIAEVSYSKVTEEIYSLWNISKEDFKESAKLTQKEYEKEGYLYQLKEFY